MSQWVMPQDSGPHLFGTRDWFCGRQFFHEWRGGFQDDSSALHLLCTLFLLLSRQLHLRPSGTRFQRLSAPILGNETDLNGWRPLSVSFLLGAGWGRVQLKSRFGDSGFEHVRLSWTEGLIWFYTIQGHLGQQMDFPHAPVQPPRLLQWRLEAKPWLIKKNKQTRPYLFVLLSSFVFVLSI